MKKLIALILAFALVLSMTACGKGNDGASSDKPADSASSNTETKADVQDNEQSVQLSFTHLGLIDN